MSARGFTAHSREFHLTCTPDGRVLSADARALRQVGLSEGDDLLAHAAPGTADKLRELLRRAAGAEVTDWETPLVVREREVLTVSFSGWPGDEGVELLGVLVPPQWGRALQESQQSIEDIVALHRQVSRQQRELEESHRGILALHAELQEKAGALRRTADLRARMVAQVSHEFRTPLHTILGLSRLLLDEVDGPLRPEQAKQVGFIKSSAEELVAFVNDLLDLSRAESGKAPLRVVRQPLTELVGALRGMLRPLVSPDARAVLEVDEPPPGIVVETDVGKVAQIVRNLVANALKFTPEGEVRVRAWEEGICLVIEVRDTGIGIAEEDLPRVFEEYGQVEHSLQHRVQGTGLGLPLSRKLAEVLGGSLEVQSTVGRGTAFTLKVPREHREVRELERLRAQPLDPGRAPVLVLEDDREQLFGYERYLSLAGFQVLPARTVDEARAMLKRVRPAVVVLDLVLESEDTWGFLSELKAREETSDVPVLVVTLYPAEVRAKALGADAFCLKPVDKDVLLQTLSRLVSSEGGGARQGGT